MNKEVLIIVVLILSLIVISLGMIGWKTGYGIEDTTKKNGFKPFL